MDGELPIDFPPDTYCHALRYGLELARIHTLLDDKAIPKTHGAELRG